jgi:hypothetical protein
MSEGKNEFIGISIDEADMQILRVLRCGMIQKEDLQNCLKKGKRDSDPFTKACVKCLTVHRSLFSQYFQKSLNLDRRELKINEKLRYDKEALLALEQKIKNITDKIEEADTNIRKKLASVKGLPGDYDYLQVSKERESVGHHIVSLEDELIEIRSEVERNKELARGTAESLKTEIQKIAKEKEEVEVETRKLKSIMEDIRREKANYEKALLSDDDSTIILLVEERIDKLKEGGFLAQYYDDNRPFKKDVTFYALTPKGRKFLVVRKRYPEETVRVKPDWHALSHYLIMSAVYRRTDADASQFNFELYVIDESEIKSENHKEKRYPDFRCVLSYKGTKILFYTEVDLGSEDLEILRARVGMKSLRDNAWTEEKSAERRGRRTAHQSLQSGPGEILKSIGDRRHYNGAAISTNAARLHIQAHCPKSMLFANRE